MNDLFIIFQNFIQEHLCQDKEHLDNYDKSSLIIVKEFTQNKNYGNNIDTFNGFVFTSRKMIEDIDLAIKLQPHGIRLMSDGTYKLILGGYCILITGTVDIKVSNNGEYSHTFRPFLFALASSENTEAYVALFQALKDLTTWAINGHPPFIAPVHCQDRCDAARNAFKNVFHPNTNDAYVIKPCYVHLIRNIQQNRSKMLKTSFYDEVLTDMDHMHHCKNDKIFKLMTSQIIKSWKNKGEIDFTNWFISELLHDNWSTWYTGCCSDKLNMFAVPDTTNPIESLNRTLKRCIPNAVSMSNFFQIKIPTIFTYITDNLGALEFDHNISQQAFIDKYPIHSELIRKAAKLSYKNTAGKSQNIAKYKSNSNSEFNYYINSSDYIVIKNSKANDNSLPVDRNRVKRYRKVHYGEITDTDTQLGLEKLLYINTLYEVEEVVIHNVDNVVENVETATTDPIIIVTIISTYYDD